MSIESRVKSLVERFNQYSDWEDRYRELIKIGKNLEELPEEFQNGLIENPKAQDFFNSLAPSYKKEYIQWIATAKQEATRIKRLNTSIEWISEGKKKSWKYEKC